MGAGEVLVDEGDGAVLHLARRVALGAGVGDLLELSNLQEVKARSSPVELKKERAGAVPEQRTVPAHSSVAQLQANPAGIVPP